MARGRIYRTEVEQARTALLAQGRHPSIDAVRVALGNTGSKTTIHRLLREIEAEEAVDDRPPAAVASTLQTAVARLAQDIESAADERIAHAQQEAAAALTALRAERDLARQQAADAVAQRDQQQTDIDRLSAELATSRRAVDQWTAQHRTAEAVAQGLRERLDDRQRAEAEAQRHADTLATRLETIQLTLDVLLTRADDATASRVASQAQRDASRLLAHAGRSARIRLEAELAYARSANAGLRGEIERLVAAETAAQSRAGDAEHRAERDRATWSATLAERTERLQELREETGQWRDALRQRPAVADAKRKPQRKSTKVTKRKESAP